MPAPPLNYSERIVCFIDVLGFREHIKGTLHPDGSDNVQSIRNIANAIEVVRDVVDIRGRPAAALKQITQFSDSLVISFPINKESGLFYALLEIMWVQMNLVTRGMLCRGGIARGKLIHTPELLFGPAMVDAYTLESKAANYPRVILDQSIIDAGVAAHARHHGPDDEKESILRLLAKDGDGMYYIDYITLIEAELDGPEQHPTYLMDLRNIIAQGLLSRDPSVKVKYLWLREKFSPYLAMLKEGSRKSPDHELAQAYLDIPEL